MSRGILLICISLAMASGSQATTIAYWDFEDGVDGQAFTPTGNPNGSGGSIDTVASTLMRG